MKEFRFGVSLRNFDDRAEWVEKCRLAERLGYDVLTVPDHLGHLAPFPALATAAAATERVRVGTMVLNTAFYHPALLAREVETTMRAAGGRLELGLGAGVVKAEFDAAGVPWCPAPERITHVAGTVEQLRRLLGEVPPLLIAGNSDGMLALAAEQADIAGFSGLKQVPGHPAGTFDLASADELDERVAFVRERAGKRTGEIEHNMLIQLVVVAEDPRPELGRWAEQLAVPRTVEQLLAAPEILAGTVDEIAGRLLDHRRRFGFSYITVFEPHLAAFASVIPALRAS
jgi:probable F420-dependent oxidoreductase